MAELSTIRDCPLAGVNFSNQSAKGCFNLISGLHHQFWSNYSDLTRPGPPKGSWGIGREIPVLQGHLGWWNYCNLARINLRHRCELLLLLWLGETTDDQWYIVGLVASRSWQTYSRLCRNRNDLQQHLADVFQFPVQCISIRVASLVFGVTIYQSTARDISKLVACNLQLWIFVQVQKAVLPQKNNKTKDGPISRLRGLPANLLIYPPGNPGKRSHIPSPATYFWVDDFHNFPRP